MKEQIKLIGFLVFVLTTSFSFHSSKSIKEIQIYPHPVKSGEIINVKFLGMSNEIFDVFIYNEQGQKIYKLKIDAKQKVFSKRIPSFIQGKFLLRFQCDKLVFNKKILVLK